MLARIALMVLCYGLWGLFVCVDGLRHIGSMKTALLTLPHLVAALALTRSVLAAQRMQHSLHSSLFLVGLLCFSALA